MQDAYIVAYSRSAFTKAKKGGFRYTRSDDLAVYLIKELIKKYPSLDSKMIDDVIVGCANPEGEQGLQIGRQISMRALGKDVAGMTVNRYCASGLETIAIATAKIRAGMGHCYLAGGVENMSMIPMEGYKFAPSYELAKEHPDYIVGMGLTAEAVAKKFTISRDAQDQFALRSHQLAAKAQENGFYKREITPVSITEVTVENNTRVERSLEIANDEGIRKDTNLEALHELKPAFALNGSVTAGNASQTTDGAAFTLIMSESMLKQTGLKPLGRLVSCSVAGVEPIHMGIGPCAAIPKALQQATMNLQDIQLIELNEAFAAQALAVIQEAGLNPDLVNVNGGAIALGHPLGCSGTRLTMTILNELELRNQKYGIVTACVGGGQGIAAVIESIS
ncbi:MAG: thiolase family protein [Saprospiraceae bacterium]|nr:thiolase family protein [Saprospiraceae bacterium]MBK7912419.1 thiolase family protein [Saprospiraceae bacterium]